MINYLHIADAERFYSKYGFKRVEVPWAVSEQAMNITSPEGAKLFHHSDEEGYLVASGEQSFFQLTLDGKLPPGSWMCITPCFRDNERDELHRPCFLKLELIETKVVTPQRLVTIADMCEEFFQRYVPCRQVRTAPPLLIDRSGQTLDIVSQEHQIELGSYGIRHHHKVGNWIYATGCAEPRLSIAIEKESA